MRRVPRRAAPRRVLVARMDSVGDVLLAGPAIRAVAAGGAKVTLLCGPRGACAGRLLPGVAELIVWRADWIDPDPQPIARERVEELIAAVAARRFEESLILTSFHQDPLPLALLLRMAGVSRVVAHSEDYPGSLLDVRHRSPENVHEVVRSLTLASAAGYAPGPGDDRHLRIRRGAALHPAARALRPYVVVHAGASVSARAWSPLRHRELVGLLRSAGRNVVLTGGAGECELTAYVAGASRRPGQAPGGSAAEGGAGGAVLDLAGDTDLAELAEVIAAADAAVVANTGPAHLAAAVGTPVVSIYAPTVPAVRWCPWKVPHRLLYRDVPCAGCRARQCPVDGHPCVDRVTARDVVDALEELLGGEEGRVAAAPPGGLARADETPRREPQGTVA